MAINFNIPFTRKSFNFTIFKIHHKNDPVKFQLALSHHRMMTKTAYAYSEMNLSFTLFGRELIFCFTIHPNYDDFYGGINNDEFL